MISNFTPLIFVLYFFELCVSFVSAFSLGKNLIYRYRRGAASTFLISLCVFLSFFGVQILTVVLWEVLRSAPSHSGSITVTLWLLWMVAHIGISVSLGFLGFFIINRRFDLYITKIQKPSLAKEE